MSVPQIDVMDAVATLEARIDGTLGDLQSAQDALRTLEVDQRLVRRIRGRLDREIETSRRGVDALAGDLRRARASGAVDAIGPLWRDYEKQLMTLRPVHQECLAFIEGILVRSRRLDRGMCNIADELLVELSDRCGVTWGRFTILGDAEFFTGLADVIRLRFPKLSIWDLPVAAHEFGHFVARNLQTLDGRRPFEEAVETQAIPIALPANANYADHLHEYFADALATYALGPAYPAVCVCLRFDVTAPHDAGATHPSSFSRAHVMIKALARKDRGRRISHPFSDLADLLSSIWANAVGATGCATAISDDQTLVLDEIEDRMFAMLQAALEPAANYAAPSWRRAEDVAARLDSGDANAQPPGDDTTVADVLNGAWAYRLGDANPTAASVRDVGAQAAKLCEEIVERRRREDQAEA